MKTNARRCAHATERSVAPHGHAYKTVIASSFGRGKVSSAATTLSVRERAIERAFDEAPAAHPSHGSRFAWCSTAVVTNDVVGREAQPIGQLIDRLRGVAPDDGNVVAHRASREPEHRRSRLLVRFGGDADLKLVSRRTLE